VRLNPKYNTAPGSKLYFIEVLNLITRSVLVKYPTPINLNYLWNFGSLAGIMLLLQLVTGLFLSMFYTGNIDYAFISVDFIVRDVHYGWLIRYLHANGASMFFLAVYIHMFKGMYYGSYKSPRSTVWTIGVIILILLMGTAFLGYVLPWGQMSFWAATVITNFVTVLPSVGKILLEWIWGAFTVSNSTLNRFYSLHYLLPFILTTLVLFHLYLLHQFGSGNPLGLSQKKDLAPFYPYYYVKDFFGLILFIIPYLCFACFFPDYLGHSDNYVEANPMVTPSHIVPEWYFLPFYAMLRSIPDKTLGILAMGSSLLIFFILPLLDKSPVRSSQFRPLFKKLFYFFIVTIVILGFLGSQPPIDFYVYLGLLFTHLYFLYFIILCVCSFVESHALVTFCPNYDVEFARLHGRGLGSDY